MDSPSNNNVSNSSIPDNEEDQVVEVPLPGFRFHPTDEELVGFYLRRKVDKKPITIELIKLIDIYKYDPWDLPKASCTAGDKEWYFFCKRGRKYKNSIRPNRVTGSGFWKATGIDKPVHSHGGEYGKNNQCIGLKKTLVYYRGSAGKGTKTDWMMHEFRLPAISDNHTTTTSYIIPPNNSVKIDPQEAEIWTLCRIFKRNVSYRRYTPDWRELSTKRHPYPVDHTICSKKLCTSTTLESNNVNNTVMINREANYNYIDFSAPRPVMKNYHDQEYHDHPQGKKPHAIINRMITNNNNDSYNNEIFSQYHDRTNQLLHFSSMASSYNNIINVPYNSTDSFSSSFSPCPDDEINDDQFFTHTSWDELKAVVELALDTDIV